MKKVVVTGIGAISPNGDNVSQIWENVSNGISGITKIENFEVKDFIHPKFGGEIKLSSDLYTNINQQEARRNDKFILYGLYAASEAIKDANLENINKDKIGVLTGSGIGGLENINKAETSVIEGKKINPFFIPSILINLLSGQISIKYGFTGPINSVVTACASGTNAIGEGARLIKDGYADIMICGGAEGALCNLGLAGFDAMHALSRNNQNFSSASRPWDKSRDGFVMSDGSGMLVLEDYEHAKKRGAKIYCEIAGYGLSADASHITSPNENGVYASKAMNMAINTAQLNPEDIHYVNAHGTSTKAGDEAELRAVKTTFKTNTNKINISSTKAVTGHLLGGAGALEAIICIMAMQHSIVPPTMHLENIEDEFKDLNLTANKAQERNLNAVISNSFGFGGFNASICLKKL